MRMRILLLFTVLERFAYDKRDSFFDVLFGFLERCMLCVAVYECYLQLFAGTFESLDKW